MLRVKINKYENDLIITECLECEKEVIKYEGDLIKIVQHHPEHLCSSECSKKYDEKSGVSNYLWNAARIMERKNIRRCIKEQGKRMDWFSLPVKNMNREKLCDYCKCLYDFEKKYPEFSACDDSYYLVDRYHFQIFDHDSRKNGSEMYDDIENDENLSEEEKDKCVDDYVF